MSLSTSTSSSSLICRQSQAMRVEWQAKPSPQSYLGTKGVLQHEHELAVLSAHPLCTRNVPWSFMAVLPFKPQSPPRTWVHDLVPPPHLKHVRKELVTDPKLPGLGHLAAALVAYKGVKTVGKGEGGGTAAERATCAPVVWDYMCNHPHVRKANTMPVNIAQSCVTVAWARLAGFLKSVRSTCDNE